MANRLLLVTAVVALVYANNQNAVAGQKDFAKEGFLLVLFAVVILGLELLDASDHARRSV